MNLLATAVVYALLTVIQKLLLQVIAVRFHRTAFMDRLREMNYASDVINKLHKHAKKILKEKTAYIQAMELRSSRQLLTDAGLSVLKKSPVKYWKKRRKEKIHLMDDDEDDIHSTIHGVS